MTLQESGEMYLETILVLSGKKSSVRAIDISEYMNFSKPSVSRAVKLLKQDGYINVADSGEIKLTEKGKAAADKIYERHTVLTACLESLGISPETAERDACRIEHIISDETFSALKKCIEK